MSSKKDLVNKKFNMLTVIKKADSILGGNKIKRHYSAWHCKCDCGKDIVVKTINLIRSKVTSCGCYKKVKLRINAGEKYNRLTAIEYKKGGKWICKCDCGKITEAITNNLIIGNTKSCGCLNLETCSKRSYKLINARRKSDPKIASAKRAWKNYSQRDKMCDIDFDNFYQLSQKNCYYCGVEPSNKYNYFLTKSSKGSEKSKSEGLFCYNGLDRIDSDGYHTMGNVVTCCIYCNRAKSNRSKDDFLSWASRLKFDYNKIIYDKKDIPKGIMGTHIKSVFFNYKKDTDMSVEEFYFISQMPCYYCGVLGSNNFSRKDLNNQFIYNGLDRIDSGKVHNKDNVVPCCKYCNFAKSKLSLQEFENWANRIQKHQKEKEPK